MNIDIVEKLTGGGVRYYLQHDYDTEILANLPGDGPFSSREQAHTAATWLYQALACVND